MAYNVMGVIPRDYTPSRRTEKGDFTIRKNSEGWKTTDTDFMPPQVLPKPMVEHLEGTKNLELARKVQAAPKE